MWFWIITGIFIIGLVLFVLLLAWGMVLGLYYRYHDFDTHHYYQPLDEKFVFSHLLNKLDEVIFAGIGVIKTDIITDTERNTELLHRKSSTNGNAYKGNLNSFNLENDEQIINFFYSYGCLRITYIYNKDTTVSAKKIKKIAPKQPVKKSLQES